MRTPLIFILHLSSCTGRSWCDIFVLYSFEWAMRHTTKPKRLYIDFDGFFASCEEQADPGLHGRPVGVIPFAGARNSCVIAANAAAKKFGVKTGTPIAQAHRLCPRITFTPQRPDLYVRIHHRISCRSTSSAR
ncbi:MAG: hypothetical protein J4F48_06030 [Nitrospinae bacterium]|nr:hypothetical protein [Nitrospinota bacterium]